MSFDWYKRYPDRWRNSMRVTRMSLAARGAYIELLDYQSKQQNGLIPNQPDLIWKFVNAESPAEWEAVRDKVLLMFTATEDGKFLFNETQREVLNERNERSKTNSLNGTKGNEKKYGHKTDTETPDTAENESPASDDHAQLRDAVGLVFSYYLSKTGRNPKTYLLTPKRREKGIKRLKEFQAQCDGDVEKATAMMRRAVDGICADDWEDRPKYRDWERHLFDSQENAEKWRNAPLSRMKVNGKAPVPVTNDAADAELRRQLKPSYAVAGAK